MYYIYPLYPLNKNALQGFLPYNFLYFCISLVSTSFLLDDSSQYHPSKFWLFSKDPCSKFSKQILL